MSSTAKNCDKWQRWITSPEEKTYSCTQGMEVYRERTQKLMIAFNEKSVIRVWQIFECFMHTLGAKDYFFFSAFYLWVFFLYIIYIRIHYMRKKKPLRSNKQKLQTSPRLRRTFLFICKCKVSVKQTRTSNPP